jgi:hypothetical protein
LNFFRSNHYSPFQFLRCVTIMRGYGEWDVYVATAVCNDRIASTQTTGE